MLKDIVTDFKEFIDFFAMKYKYDNRGILKKFKLRSGLNKQLSEEEWYELFIIKSALNHCAKFLLIKYYEDNEKIASKINKKGLDKWRNLVSNIEQQLGILYEIAEKDCGRIDCLKFAFNESEFDLYKIDDELATYIIDKSINYDLSGYPDNIIYQIFTPLYYDEKRTSMNLQLFYKPANAIEYVLSLNA
ncbi:hypothetical protein [Proteiniborus sp. MB09-C3]|uniref:hypothetical protein n=1 Tax=Proteiniborus sp. MB09-C3 TaxID=3050072 RepID=UPI00255594AE|nr:hypothetical protein [Proteiniborus sp. MB09-C3]WIV10658.1 hypothetical protein QO263_10865 [Proteiniborus sp. MB09-C3]